MGILTDIFIKQTGRKWAEQGFGNGIKAIKGSKNTNTLPTIVEKWSGFDEDNEYRKDGFCIGYLNDDEKLTFTQIADILEERFLVK